MTNLITRYHQEFWRDATVFGSTTIHIFLIVFFLMEKNTAAAAHIAAAYFLTLLICIAIRHFFFKARPRPQLYATWFQKMEASSFPSVHAARAGALFFILSNAFQDIKLTVTFLILALLVLVSRIILKKHDIVDVLAGAVLGVGIGWLLSSVDQGVDMFL